MGTCSLHAPPAPPLSILGQRAARRLPPAPIVVSGPVGLGGDRSRRAGPPSRLASAVRRAAFHTGSGAEELARPPECLQVPAGACLPTAACSNGGAVVRVTNPGPLGIGVRAGAPRRTYRMGARARYAGARFEPGGYDSPPGLTPRVPATPARSPRGRNGIPAQGRFLSGRCCPLLRAESPRGPAVSRLGAGSCQGGEVGRLPGDRLPGRREGRALPTRWIMSLIHVQVLRLSTWQYPSPRPGQPIKVMPRVL